MSEKFINLNLENVDSEHLCCAIARSKHKHYEGVLQKKEWLKSRILKWHVFRKLDERAKVFIEYVPVEEAFVPINGDNYNYIYCFWVSGKFKKHGYGQKLLNYAIEDSKEKGKSGLCVISGEKKLNFLSDGKYLKKYGFKTVDKALSFQLLALSFDNNPTPSFSKKAKMNMISDEEDVVIYYTSECPFVNNCVLEIEEVCDEEDLSLKLIHIDNLEKAKNSPVILNNFAVFFKGEFLTHELLNKGRFRKFLNIE
jgi:ribosomal protein S18 acetylase RimI-like enzyme